eukprot:TRINITY_DN7513_c0_g1_i2.p1 TRINITY_DN7513_c0_g1~~TRINITY_DN7513_c0_g1_i2.p1  ORF type:complete len:171 (+),score=5.11 TRINITY_DN7513_c0_g1_i2:123-635(+)
MSPTTAPIWRRPVDLFFILFFVVHIPTAALLDAQSILPTDWFHEELLKLTKSHIDSSGDPLVSANPPWFKALVWCELIFQVPYFVVATYAFIRGKTWIRTPTVMYCAHVVTTMVPIFFELMSAALPSQKRVNLVAIYLPFLVVPLLLLARILSSGPDNLFGSKEKGMKTE